MALPHSLRFAYTSQVDAQYLRRRFLGRSGELCFLLCLKSGVWHFKIPVVEGRSSESSVI